MTQDAAYMIRVVIRQEPDYFYAASADLPGLHVCGSTRAELGESLVNAITALFKHNRNIDVRVLPLANSMDDEFPDMPVSHFGDQFVVHRCTA